MKGPVAERELSLAEPERGRARPEAMPEGKKCGDDQRPTRHEDELRGSPPCIQYHEEGARPPQPGEHLTKQRKKRPH